MKDHNIELYGIDGYNSEHAIRSSRTGGGVSIFIQDNIEYFLRNDLSSQNDNIESLFIEINKDQLNKSKNVVVGVVYRPPNTNITAFNDTLSDILLKIKKIINYHTGLVTLILIS